MKKRFIFIILNFAILSVLFMLPNTISNASSYNYDFWSNAIPSSEGLSYKDTYYGKDILASNNALIYNNSTIQKAETKESLKFEVLEDMAIYDGKMYILDGRSMAEDPVELPNNETVTEKSRIVNKRSAIYIINSEMKWEKAVYEFKITDEVYNKIKDYYQKEFLNYNTPFDQVTYSSINQYSINSYNSSTGTVTVRAPYIALYDDTLEKYVPGIFLREATGIAVNKDFIYIADTENSRIVKMTHDFLVVDIFFTPNDTTFYQYDIQPELSTKTVFKPSKIVVDRTSRVYIVAKDTYEGIIEYNAGGTFNRFLGKNLVTATPFKSFWASILSDYNLNFLELDLPPQFTNIAMDEDGFLYATSNPETDKLKDLQLIKSINTSGKDVLKRNGYVKPDGDAKLLMTHPDVTAQIGVSIFVDVAVSNSGIYTAVDKIRGRLFTYDNEGNLLYISGEKGSLSDSIGDPTALGYLTKNNEEFVVVIDQTSKSIISFQTTEFGKLVNEATKLYLIDNDIDKAKEKWQEVVDMNSNYELGYVGIGKSLLRNGEYKKAMEFFELGHNAVYYSKAYQIYRDEILKENFNVIMTGIIIMAVGFAALIAIKYVNRKKTVLIRNNEINQMLIDEHVMNEKKHENDEIGGKDE